MKSKRRLQLQKASKQRWEDNVSENKEENQMELSTLPATSHSPSKQLRTIHSPSKKLTSIHSSPKKSTSILSAKLEPRKLVLRRSHPLKYKCYGKRSVPTSSVSEYIQDPVANDVPVGRRLISIQSLNQIMSLAADHGRQCSFPLLQIVKEIRKGLQSTLTASCETCMKLFQFSNDIGPCTLPVNEAGVWAGHTNGGGFTIMKHSLTALDLPFMDSKTYTNLENRFSKQLHSAFLSELQRNGEEEKRMAIELGQIDHDGVPWTDVLGDGQWSKRSFNQQGRALSGSAVLIGLLTKKPLFVGVRNKVCFICKTQPEKEHECFKNWDGSSSAMETNIIMEGFKRSIEMHGIRYRRFVGDGDSSVYQGIKDTYLNKDYFTCVQKIQCYLHGIRAMNKNLLLAIKNSNRNSGYPKFHRDCLEDRVHLFGKYANYLIALHIQERPNGTNSDTLAEDLIQMPRHIFGDHRKCSKIMCNNGEIVIPQSYRKEDPSPARTLKNPPSAFFTGALWKEIEDITGRLATLSVSLLYRMNTNIAETFQAHVNKFAQGRRTNNILRGGYNRKVEEATFSFMYGPTWYVDLYQKIEEREPSSIWLRAREAQQKTSSARRARPQAKRPRQYHVGKGNTPQFFSKRKPEGDKDDGPNAQREDLPEEEMQFRIQQFLVQHGVETKEEQWELHSNTVGQFDNPTYVQHRHGMITASIAGTIAGLKNSTSNVSVIDQILWI
ncbi:hypothetical protein Fcan01_00749 [Folsomia candida]|uniref:Mutator-like transposase domain-containing protein n=1 Tax=Folsomia candida TaxID=158441 RepID=A0A226EZU0_FOLCA|nr:hypothetical protein Fcan01_00749 [Folsomia candida]